ncbi:uncharacterized protein UHO2_00195 [Ustilago hordei]|uniref:uncharacterized protein n=1 Tax=Ustilago hordei TaxID=120017 RepID=UPI001A638046|nr:uncharacterized protein UHO2_00195 [Ustilago hordei]SYW81691.1 uncharacterized protein UHO2_00195 [Ustilago hordei]
MVEDTETQVGASTRTKGSRKGNMTQVRADNDATNKNELEVINNEADKEAVMGLNAQEAGGSLVHMEGAQCSLHGDHGLLQTHMQRRTEQYARRARHSHEEDQAQGACRWLPLRGSRDKSQRNHHQSKEKEQCIGNWQAGPKEEEQCRRSQHHSGGTRVPNKQDSKEEEQCRRSRHSSRGTGVPSKQERPPEQYSMKKVLSGERAGAASLAML